MRTYRHLPTLLVAILLLLPAGIARAQVSDVDAFALQGAEPNIMLVIDNSGSMNNFASGCSDGGSDEKDRENNEEEAEERFRRVIGPFRHRYCK